MTWQSSVAVRSARAQSDNSIVNTGGGTAVIEVRTGTPPGIGNAASGTLLASFSLPNPAFTEASGVLTLAGVPISATAAATGTAGYARLISRAGTAVGEGTVTATGGGGDFQVASTSFVSGTTQRITGGTLTY